MPPLGLALWAMWVFVVEIGFQLHHYCTAAHNDSRLQCRFCWSGCICKLNSLRPRRNGRYNADDSFKCIFLKGNVWIMNIMLLKFVPKGPINNIPALVQIMALRRPGNKPLSEPMMVSLLTHICVTRPQWVDIHSTCWHPAILRLFLIYQNVVAGYRANDQGIVLYYQQ